MNRIEAYLNAAIESGKAKNDAEIARLLHVSRPTISRWRKGECAPNANEARALAELTNTSAGALMAEAEAERAKDDATRAEWLRVARLCQQTARTTALSMFAAVILYMTTPGTSHAESSPYKPPSSHNADSKLLRRLRAALQKLTRTARGWGMLRPK